MAKGHNHFDVIPREGSSRWNHLPSLFLSFLPFSKVISLSVTFPPRSVFSFIKYRYWFAWNATGWGWGMERKESCIHIDLSTRYIRVSFGMKGNMFLSFFCIEVSESGRNFTFFLVLERRPACDHEVMAWNDKIIEWNGNIRKASLGPIITVALSLSQLSWRRKMPSFEIQERERKKEYKKCRDFSS